jgi:iron complex transport system substrate-binding protein
LVAACVAGALLLSACGSTSNATDTSATSTSATPTTSAAPTSDGQTTATESSPEPSAASASASASPTSGSGGLDAKGCITDFDADTDYYPVKSTLEYATNFTLSYHKSYQVLTVVQPEQGGKPESYVLVKCGAPKPELTGELAKAQVVTTPVQSLFSASTSHLPNLVALDRLDVLTGVAAKAFISEKQVLDRVADSDVVEFAPANTVDAEKVVAAKPDVLITAGYADPAYATIEKAGIPVLADAEWLENNPLGRAEWIKYFAALTGTEDTATTVFDGIAEDYNGLRKQVADAEKVQIVPGQPYQGTWFVPGGKSFNATLFADAGGATAWSSDTSTGSLNEDFESVFAKASDAPVWLASTTWTTKADALKEDPRFAKFAAFKSGNVWNAAKDVNSAGANNYYELGVLRPDLILGDLVAILHPEVMGNHEFAFYLKLS